ncbi:hypothetical protein ACE6H2_008061 [Prunus campanulata]
MHMLDKNKEHCGVPHTEKEKEKEIEIEIEIEIERRKIALVMNGELQEKLFVHGHNFQ